MHISSKRAVELRYALLKGQAQELTITEFLTQHINNERELCWLYHWLNRHASWQKRKLDRQFELHRLVALVLDEKEDIEELYKLSQEEIAWVKQVLEKKAKALEVKIRADQGEPIRYSRGAYARDNNPRAATSSNDADLQHTGFHPSWNDPRMEPIEEQEQEQEQEGDLSDEFKSKENCNRYQASEEDAGPVCELPASSEYTDD